MVRFTKVLFIAATVVSTGACKKDGGAAGGGSGGAGGGALAILPEDSQYVFGLNLGAARQSPLWKEYGSKLVAKAAADEKYAQMKTDCGFDPIDTVNTVTVGAKAFSGPNPDTVIVVDGLDKAKVLACADKEKDQLAKNNVTLTRDGDYLTVKDKDSTTEIGFAGSELVAVTGTKATKDGIAEIIKGDHALAKSSSFMGLVGKVNTQDAIWAVVNGDVPFLSASTPLGKPQAIYGSLKVTDGIALDAHIKAADADKAKAFVDMAKQQSAMAAAFVDKLDITNAAEDVKIVITMSADKLKALKSQIPGM